MVIETAGRLFSAIADDAAVRFADDGEWPGDAWDAIAEMGLPLALVPEDSGGFGMDAADALALIRLSARHALPLPLAETMVANLALAQAGLEPADGPASFVPAHGEGRVWIDGAKRVPWARHAKVIVVEGDDGRIARITGARVVGKGSNLAGMPRDDIALAPGGAPDGPRSGASLLLWGAAMRTLQIAGAMERVLMLTIRHVEERQQFGRPLVKFQAVQHELAKLAGEVAAAGAAADMAAEAMLTDRSDANPAIAIAAARIRSGEAVGTATSIAQQLHGAIGFTREHRLHRHTTALWSWREEYGGQHYWTQMLGGLAMAAGGAGFWPFVTEAA